MTNQNNSDASKALDTVGKVDRAAILLMTLGEADAAEILKHFGPKEVQRVGSAMSKLSEINQTQV